MSRAAAVLDYTSVVNFSTSTSSSVSSPVLLNFSFPGSLVDIEKITISGSFFASDPWGFREQFAFTSADGSIVGPSYYYVYSGTTKYLYNFTLEIYPGSTNGLTLTNDIFSDLSFGDKAAFQSYLTSELVSGSVSLLFQPEARKIAAGNSTFALQSVSLTVRGVDPPMAAPIPGGGALFLSGIAVLFCANGRTRWKPFEGGLWRVLRRRDRMRRG